MTKLADELEALAKDATPGPWSYEKDFEGSSMGWVDGPKRPREGKFPLCGLTLFDVCGDFGEQEINASLIVALRNALPEIIAALRQPDAVPGDLVNKHLLPMASLMRGDGDNHAADCFEKAAAAIQSLTAERDALQQALADAQGAMTLTAEIGVTYFDQRNEALAERDAALARVAELKAGVGNIKKLATKRLFEGGPDGNLAAIEGFARALLEGSKP